MDLEGSITGDLGKPGNPKPWTMRGSITGYLGGWVAGARTLRLALSGGSCDQNRYRPGRMKEVRFLGPFVLTETPNP